MRTLFSGEIYVHYGQAYVESEPDTGLDLHDALAGQQNGLCGAATPGGLFLITGLHTGDVGFTVELHPRQPPTDEAWEEIVEVSFTPASSQTFLVQWSGEATWPLELEQIDHRVRYCASGMDAANEADTRLDDEPQLDRYLLQFWPAPQDRDLIVKQTSQTASYWHKSARETPSPQTPEP